MPKARHQTVQAWMKSRVPAEYCPDVEAETRALGTVVHCERLRPDVQWGRIRGFEGPAVGGEAGGDVVHAANVDQASPERAADQKVEEKF